MDDWRLFRSGSRVAPLPATTMVNWGGARVSELGGLDDLGLELFGM